MINVELKIPDVGARRWVDDEEPEDGSPNYGDSIDVNSAHESPESVWILVDPSSDHRREAYRCQGAHYATVKTLARDHNSRTGHRSTTGDHERQI